MVYPARPHLGLPTNENLQRRQMVAHVQNSIWPLQILSNIFWVNKRTNKLLRIHQQDLCRKAWHFCHYIPRWYPDLYWRWWRWSRCSRTIGFKITQKVLIIRQSEKVLILLWQGLVSRLYDILKRHPHRDQKNWDC